MLFSELCEIFKNSFFTEHFLETALVTICITDSYISTTMVKIFTNMCNIFANIGAANLMEAVEKQLSGGVLWKMKGLKHPRETSQVV